MDAKQVRIGIYARISEDRDGQQTATARQREDARASPPGKAGKSRTSSKSRHLTFKTNVKRPEFARMLGALRSGDINGVVVWKLDRLSHQQRDLVRVTEACEVHKAFIASVMEPFHTSQSYGQFIAELSSPKRGWNRRTRAPARPARRWSSANRGCPHPTAGAASVTPVAIRRSSQRRRHCYARQKTGCSRERACGASASTFRRGVWSRRPGTLWRTQILKRLLHSATLSGQREHEGKLFPADMGGDLPATRTPSDCGGCSPPTRVWAGRASQPGAC